jgi:K+-sensing histidine kinase KdpD
MSKQEKNNLFKLFGTMRNDKYSKIKGVGLGLCISRMIVESFGGKIEVESEPELGSTFTYNFSIDTGHLIDSSEDSDEREDEVAMLPNDV